MVDGVALPAHPFDPVAAPSAAGVPLVIGTNKDEMALFLFAMPGYGELDGQSARAMLNFGLGGSNDVVELYDVYEKIRPDATPTEIVVAIMTDRFRVGSIQLAERKVKGGSAPTYMYLFTWETPILDGKLKSAHTLEIAFVFDHVDDVPMTGSGPERYGIAAAMSDAWIAFARTGNPNHAGLADWPTYDTGRRATMIFDVDAHVEDDPMSTEREAWEARGLDAGI